MLVNFYYKIIKYKMQSTSLQPKINTHKWIKNIDRVSLLQLIKYSSVIPIYLFIQLIEETPSMGFI